MRSLLLILNRLRIKEAFFSRFKGAEPLWRSLSKMTISSVSEWVPSNWIVVTAGSSRFKLQSWTRYYPGDSSFRAEHIKTDLGVGSALTSAIFHSRPPTPITLRVPVLKHTSSIPGFALRTRIWRDACWRVRIRSTPQPAQRTVTVTVRTYQAPLAVQLSG
jgi:hypothetical protein